MQCSLKDSLRAKFACAVRGIYLMWLRETSMRIHFAAASFVFWLGFVLGVSGGEWAILVLVVSIVVVSEGFNCVLERLMDVLEPNFHPLVRHAKDAAAGTVLAAAVASVFIGYLIFWPKLWMLPTSFGARLHSSPFVMAGGLATVLGLGAAAVAGVVRR